MCDMRRASLGILGAAVLISGGLGALLRADHSSRATEGKQTTRPPYPEPDAATIRRVLAAYAGGDDQAVVSWLSILQRWTTDAYRDFESVVRRNDVPRRVRLAFAIEAVVAGRDPFFPDRLLNIGRELIEDQALGVDAEADRFEVLWHQTAIAAMESTESFTRLRRYVDEVAPRYDSARRRGFDVPTRFLLARGHAALGVCCPEQMPGPSPGIMTIVNYRPRVEGEMPTLDGAVLFFRQASAIPALEVEALIRAGVAMYGGGRHEAALGFLERVPAHADVPLGYVQHLTRGHVFDELNRPADAAAAYRRAMEYMPTSQSAAIGRAAALLRAGDTEAAAHAAVSAKRLPRVSLGADPRVTFRRADARFIPSWLAEIRRLK